MKRIFCYASELQDKINLYIYLINVKNVSFLSKTFKKKFKNDYHIVKEIILSFPSNEKLTEESLKNYGNIIKGKLKEFSFDDSPIDLVFDFNGVFRTKFALPKLSGKVLESAYQNELARQFGKFTNEYIINRRVSTNQNKGYDFDIIMVKEDRYQKLLGIFTSAKLKVEKCTYLPSIFTNIVDDNTTKNVCILMDENKTYLFILDKGEIEDYKVVPIGFEHINESIREKFALNKSEVNRFREENISKIALRKVIYQTMRKIIEQIYFLLLTNTNEINEKFNPNINKTYIYSLDGKTEELLLGFPLLLRKKFDVFKIKTDYRYQILIDAYYNNQKNFSSFKTKVKYGKK